LNVRDLRDGLGSVDIEGEVTSINDPKTVNLRGGGEARVANANFRDAQGQSISLALFDDQIDVVSTGGWYRISKGYTNTFGGHVQLNVGKYGKIEPIVGPSTAPSTAAPKPGSASPAATFHSSPPGFRDVDTIKELESPEEVNTHIADGTWELLGWSEVWADEVVALSEGPDGQKAVKRAGGPVYIVGRVKGKK
jgi:replication factor A1